MKFSRRTSYTGNIQPPNTEEILQQQISDNLNRNMEKLKEIFTYPVNHSLQFREVFLPFLERKGMILFLEGTVDLQSIEDHIVAPLLKNVGKSTHDEDLYTALLHVLTASTIDKIVTLQSIIENLLTGNTIILLDKYSYALSVKTPGFENRSVSEPKVENLLIGPKEAFIESASTNRSLIRKHIKDHRLMCEMIPIGSLSRQQVSIMYMKHIANPHLVQKVKERITQINADSILNLSILEQHIEDRSYSLISSVLTTERPDRASSFLLEGHVVLLMENSPAALIVPVTFWSFFHSAEDQYIRWPYGNFLRLIRIMATFVALLTPSVYLAVSNFHVEMLPTDLMLAIAATRERVPFPTLIEILIMEFSFEILREAGVRIPSVIGPTIGIVGALILGQAAVQANIVSPILVIIVAITGLSSFTIPESSLNLTIRILRFFILLSAAIMGFFGIALFLSFLAAYLVSVKSFGVPFLSPLAPHKPSSKDLIFRPPTWKQWLRPFHVNPVDKIRKKKPEGN